MRLVGFLKLGFNCFDWLAWPLFGMGFPLYASVRAIENNSNPEMRNLVAYWILFSLVSLFELAFVRLIDWPPFWPYLKLMAVCLLVLLLPNFNGASYVYECLLHPCLSLDLRAAIKYFIKPKEDKNLDTKSFLAALDRYVQENGSEALEKLVDRKSKHKKPDIGVGVTKAMTYTEEKETAAAIQSKYEEPNVGKVDARAAELPEKSPVSVTKLSKVKEPHVDKENANAGEVKDESPAIATEQEARLATAKSNLKSPRWQVKCVETNLALNESKTVAAGENIEKTVAAVGGESKAVEIIDSKKVQREWKLKASKQVNESEGFSSLFQSKHTKPDIAAEEIKAITNTGEMETGAAIQFKYEEPDVGNLDARAVGLPDESPGAATKWSNVKEPHVVKENDNVGELKDEIPAVATGEEAKSATTQSGHISLLPVKCVVPNLTQYEKNTVADEAIKEKIVAAPGGEGNKAMKKTNSEKVQSEWTCALCQVTATCEKTRDSHLQGRKHKAQELKASKQANNNTDEGGKETVNNDGPKNNSSQPQYTTVFAGNLAPEARNKETVNNDGPKNSSQPQYTTVFAGNLAPEARNKETVNNNGPKNSSQPQYTTVFAGNLAPEVSQLDLHRHFHTLGAGVIEEVRIQRDKGFGFVRYSTHAEAALAIRMGNTCSMLFGKQIKCSWGSKPTPPGTSSNPLPPPVAARPAPMPWFSAGEVLAYEWQLAMAKMGGGEHPLMHPQGQQHHLLKQAAMGMDSAGAGQAIYDGGFQNVAAAQQLMYYQ